MKATFFIGVLVLAFILLLQPLSSAPVLQKAFFEENLDCTSCVSVTECIKCLNSKIISESKRVVVEPQKQPEIKPIIQEPADFASVTEKLIHALINEERVKQGLPELQLNTQLSSAARLHSQDMAKYNYFSHTSRNGRDFSTRISQQGITCSSSAENIAMNSGLDEYSTASVTVQGWMNSAGHRANILTGYGYEGIGVAISENGSVYVTEDFC